MPVPSTCATAASESTLLVAKTARAKGTSLNRTLAIKAWLSTRQRGRGYWQGDLIIINCPMKCSRSFWRKSVAPHLKAGKALGAHGFNVHFKTITPPKDVDVLLIAPKYRAISFAANTKGRRRSCLLAILPERHRQSPATSAWPGPAASAAALLRSSSKLPSRTNAETDLFGE